jgi:SagB-type dehydrogenase family enzyme
MPDDSALEKRRYFLKDTIRQEVDFSQTDQSRGEPPPPIEKPFSATARQIELAAPGHWQGIGPIDLETAIANRQSRRRFLDDPFTCDELSFLLWATQGVRQQVDSGHAFRTVPSAGARHAFETYVCARNVVGLEAGFYRYLPLEHRLLFEFQEEDTPRKLAAATFGQTFVATAAVTFIWTVIPYRMEWRYGLAAHKVIALDAGHVCQNLYLACEAVGAGTCAIAAYHQQLMDQLLQVDGRDEFTIYLAPVGKIAT